MTAYAALIFLVTSQTSVIEELIDLFLLFSASHDRSSGQQQRRQQQPIYISHVAEEKKRYTSLFLIS